MMRRWRRRREVVGFSQSFLPTQLDTLPYFCLTWTRTSLSLTGLHHVLEFMITIFPQSQLMITIRNSSTNLRTLKTFSISVSCLECQAGWSLVEKVWQAQPRRQNLERRSKTLTTQCIDRNFIIFFTKLLTFYTN